MKTTSNLFVRLTLAIALSVSFFCPSVRAESVRHPVYAGRFYEADPVKLRQHIDSLTEKAGQTSVQVPGDRHLKALVMPHAGHIYSGWTAAHVAGVLQTGQYSKVILIGPDHRIGLRNAAICDASAYETPLGRIHFHKDIKKLRQQPDLFHPLPVSSDKEHSLEVILPFLQQYLSSFQLVPVIVGFGDVSRLSKALDSIVDSSTLIVVSSDLSHFLPYSEAVLKDSETIAEIVNLAPDKLANSDDRACGKNPLLILTELARRHDWQPTLLHYSNSGDTAGDRSRVVGYAAIAYFEDPHVDANDGSGEKFSENQGQILVKLARRTIMDKLGVNTAGHEFENLDADLEDVCFKSHRGTFVTLKIEGQLRGCIGSLAPAGSIVHGIQRNALNAAFHDPRFAPLSKAELDLTRIEVSILTEPQPLFFRDGQDLIRKLNVHVDGVIIQKGNTGATFLPQVWEQLPRPEDFLTRLCLKAGLPPETWKKPELNILTYQVQYFEESQ